MVRVEGLAGRSKDVYMTAKNRSMSYPTLKYMRQNSSSPGSTTASSNSIVNNSESEHGEYTMEITHIGDVPSLDMLSTSAILHYCKRIILLPYIRLLTVLGWRPLAASEESSWYVKVFSAIYAVVVLLFTLLGYVLQVASCFRRDRASGFQGKLLVTWESAPFHHRQCDGSLMGLYLLPSILHLAAYAYTFFLLRISEYEQIQILMEKVFLQTFHSPLAYSTQPKLVKTLRSYLTVCILWLIFSLAAQILHVLADPPTFTWMDESHEGVRIGLVVLMLLTLLWHDILHVTILWSYGIQCQLLVIFLHTLCERLLGKMSLQLAIKEIDESCKMLKHLNDDMAIGVAILLLYSGSLVASGIVWLLTPNCPCTENNMLLAASALAVITWGTAFCFPIVQAARLTAACKGLRRLSHHLRARPFGYQDTPQQDLDSFMLYTSTLNMHCTLFRVPVRAGGVFCVLALVVFLVVLLCQLDLISLGL